MPLANLFVGSLYQRNYNGTAWSQPGGPGTTVFPQQQINVPFAAYPVPGQVWMENSGLWNSPCGHWFNAPRIQMDHDDMLGQSAALVLCPLCSYIIRIIEPFSAIDDVISNPVIIP